MPDDDENNHARIHVTFDDPEAVGVGGESMWAVREGDGPGPDLGLYRINNLPFFCSLRYDDLVLCRENIYNEEHEYTQIPEFEEIVESSPNQGGILLFNPEMPEEQRIALVEEFRTSFDDARTERAVATVWAIALPADPAVAEAAATWLELKHRDKFFDYELDQRDDDD